MNRLGIHSEFMATAHHGDMADFLAVIGTIGFVVAMLGLIKGLERV